MKVLVVAPHPDDETLGAGGYILRHKSIGNSIAWLIITERNEEFGWDKKKVKSRKIEIEEVAKLYNFDAIYNLGLPTAKLDQLPMSDMVAQISEVISDFEPNEILIPHKGDTHTDHEVTHKAVISCTKWFRYPSIERVFAYETLSETEFGFDASHTFIPNRFVDITDFLDAKVKAMKIYSSEIGNFPFPRSETAIKSLAQYRGASSGFMAAEAFHLIFERF